MPGKRRFNTSISASCKRMKATLCLRIFTSCAA